MKRKTRSENEEGKSREERAAFSMRDCEERVGGKETKGFEVMRFWFEVIRSWEVEGGGEEVESKEQKGRGGDWSATPLAALHNACGVIWCM